MCEGDREGLAGVLRSLYYLLIYTYIYTHMVREAGRQAGKRRSWEEKESVVAVEEKDVHESDRVKESSSLFCSGERNGGKERQIR